MRLWPVLLMLMFCQPAIAQPSFPASGPLYWQQGVARIDILIHPDSLAWIYEHVESDHEFRATFVYNNGLIHDTLHNIGFRLRGNTSRYAPKKSFKISFNTFIPGRKYHGVEKLNLNGEHNDPSVIRARICWNVFNQSRLAVPRSSHVQVYINGNYYGLYINVEHIDENFVKSRFGNNDGDLYKCLYPADLQYLGSDPDAYKIVFDNRRVYEQKIRKDDNYTLLAHFIDVLNNTAINQLPCELEKVFNVQDYLKIAAIDVLTANWDGYIFNKNNFYLYFNTKTGLFEYIPYDVDNTFGIDWFNIPWSQRNVYQWAPAASSEYRPLYKRLMQVPEYKADFTFYLKQAIQNITGTIRFTDSIAYIRDMIRPYVFSDPYYPLTYGYSIHSFNNSYNMALGQHVPVGLFQYISARNTSALAQLITSNTPPVIKYLNYNKPLPSQPLIISVFSEDDGQLSEVALEFRIDGGSWSSVTMLDDGQHNDGVAGDGTYGVFCGPYPQNTLFEFRIRAKDNLNQHRIKPCDPVRVFVTQPPGPMLYINEFMASNSSTIADEYGEYDDWIEIYNPGAMPLCLGGMYLTDNFNYPAKWAFPDTVIAAKGFVIVWADGQTAQGSMHTNFKLDREGEKIAIYRSDDNEYERIDWVVFETQSNDVSQGRAQDGAETWLFFKTPTPGRSNNTTGIVTPEMPHRPLLLYPNPVFTNTLYLNDEGNYTITDTNSRELMHFVGREVDITNLSNGLYILWDSKRRPYKFLKLRR